MRSTAHIQSFVGLCACLLSFPLSAPHATAQTAAPGQWTWVGGSSSLPTAGYIPAVYGTLGVFEPANTPGSRTQAAAWTDSSGRLWLFGGFNFDNQLQLFYFNDLWEFDPSTMQWAWMGGSNTPASNCPIIEQNITCGSPGVYGTQGEPTPSNWPGGRYSIASWVDAAGRFWLYGGWGIDALNQVGILGDLWVYDPSTSQWTWMGGDTTLPTSGEDDNGVYGMLGVPAAANYPGSLTFVSHATDPDGNTWLFGGWGYNGNTLNGLSNKLLEYVQSSGEWGWMAGPVTSDPDFDPAVYGTQGVAAAANTPSSRWDVFTWADSAGNIWSFGGDGYDNSGDSGLFNQLWEFNTASSGWAWISGPQLLTCAPGSDNQNCGNPGVYGTLGQPAPGNLPGGRSRGANWTDINGNLWLFGGIGFDAHGYYNPLNDLWRFDPATRQWAWMGGPTSGPNGPAVYGVLGVPAPANLPGRRDGATSWTGKDGNFWLYGGNGLDADNYIGILNDLWLYQPATTAASFSLSANPAAVTVSAGSSGTSTITSTVIGGFDSAISLVPTGQPASVVIAFQPAAIAGAGTSAMTMSVAPTAAPGVYPITITGTGAGISKSTRVTLTIIAATPPGFTISLNPQAITIQAGQTGTTTVLETATGGFDANVAYSCSGLPAGAACTFALDTVLTTPNLTYTKLTVSTTATSAAIPRQSRPLLPLATVATLLCCISWKRHRRLQIFLLLLLSVAGFSLLSGCVVHYTPHGGSGTPIPIVVTGASGTLQSSATLTLTVN